MEDEHIDDELFWMAATMDHEEYTNDEQLRLAVFRGDYPRVQDWMELGANVHYISPHGSDRTPLLLATVAGRADICQLLLYHGADPNIGTASFHSPLLESIAQWDVPLVRLFLNNGATVCDEALFRIFEQRDYRRGLSRVDTVRLLIENGADMSARDEKNQTPLHVAVAQTDNDATDIVRVLLDNEADVAATDQLGQTPLHTIAERRGSSETLRLLLNRGANLSARDARGNTPLHVAAKKRNEEVFFLLMHPETCQILNEDGKSPLCICCENLFVSGVESLLSKYEEWKLEVSTAALHCALVGFRSQTSSPAQLRRIQFDTIFDMLLLSGMDVNENLENVGTTLQLVVSWAPYSFIGPHQRHVVRLLLAVGADPNVKQHNDETPLHLAAQSLNTGVVSALLEKGANVHAVTAQNKTPLHLALQRGGTVYLESKTVSVLLQGGAFVDQRDNEGYTALHILVRRRADPRVLKIFLDHQANVNAKGYDGSTPLHSICSNQPCPRISCWCAQLLLEQGANPFVRDSDGNMPAHIAARNVERSDLMIRALLQSNPKCCSEPDPNGFLPVDLACMHGASLDSVYLLVRADPTSTLVARYKYSPDAI